MSNEDFDPDQIGPPRDNVVDYILAQQRAAMVNAMPQDDDDPEKAARAIELSNATGVHPALIQADQENFEQQHKAALTASLLRNNKFLMDYAANPMAAKVSANDWGQLDVISNALQKIGATPVVDKAIQGFVKHFGEEGPGSYLPGPVERLQHPEMGALAAIVALAGSVPEMTIRTFSGLIGGVAEGGAELYKQITGRDAEDKTESLLQMAGDPGFWASIGLPIEDMTKVLDANKKLKEEIAAVAPFVKAGQPIPVGASKVIDQLHAEQAKLDLKNVDETFKESQKSSTKEIAPDVFADKFARIHTDSRIGIDAEAVRKLYGDKLPEADDNLLGWVKGIQDQLALAEAHGGDVEVPLADWLAKADPEVAKELHDFIRVRPGGMTLEETKEAGKPVELEAPQEGQGPPPPVTPEETLRKSAGLEPIFGRGYGKDNLVPDEPGIIPVNATSYEGEPRLIKGTDETLSPYLNFPLKEGLKQINSEYTGDVPMVMQEFYKDRLSKIVGDVPVHIVKDADMDRYSDNVYGGKLRAWAFYNPSTDEIYMSDKIASGQAGHDKASWILIHEGAHALTFNAMRKNPELKAMVLSLRDAFKSYWKEEDPTLLEEPGHKYALQNADEFWSQSWSSEEMKHSLSMTPVSEELAKAIGMKSPEGKSIYDAFRRVVRIIIQKVFPGMDVPPTMVDALFHLQSKFEQAVTPERGKLLGPNELQAAMKPEDAERDLFTKANAIGMTKDQYSRYMDLISKRAAEDLAHQVEQGKAIERERQTKEWKDNFARVRDEVRADIRNRPDLAADRLLREGDLHGQKVRQPQLDGDSLSPEQKAALPKDYYRSGGVSPDAVANLFGYQSGDALVAGLARLKQERELEGLTPAAHLSKVVDAETERQMRKQYGNLEENILAEAKDHVISQTQLDLLHEETLALGQQSGASLPMSKDDFKHGAKELFNDSPLGSHSTDKYLAAAGRAGAKAEQALLEGKPSDAFKAKQQQYISLLLANEAKKLEKEQKRNDRLMKNLAKAEPSGLDPEYANFAQDILMRIGGTGIIVKRSVQGLARQRELVSNSKDLRSFVESVNTKKGIWGDDPDAMPVGQQMPVADFLLDSDYRKDMKDMTVEEYRAVFNSLRTIDKNGREIKSYNVKGEKRALELVVSGLVERLKAAIGGKPISTSVEQATSVGRTIGSLILNPESWFKRLDLGNAHGPFSQLIVRPIVEGQYSLKTLEREHSKEYRALGEIENPGKKIENSLFREPRDKFASFMEMTRENLYAVLQNMGNKEQRRKLALGYGIDNPDKIWQFLATNGVTKEDVARAQKMGDFFSDIFKKSEQMYTSISGVSPERIQLSTVQTPWGPIKEWYHPLIPDPLRHGGGLKAADMMEESGYFKPSPASGYTKQRTGAVYPIDLTFNSVPAKIKQMLNDIAMHPAITEVSKILLNKDFQNTFTHYYGKEYEKALTPWLRDAAGQRRYIPSTDAAVDSTMNFLRENLSTLMIGMNLGTVLKHFPTATAFSIREVGIKNFVDSFTHIVAHDTPDGQTRARFAMENSEELQNRLRSTKESISATNADLFKHHNWNHKFFTIRDAIQTLGALPVAMSDFISAVPMWDAAYRKGIEAGKQHGEAVYDANTAVRRTHGSSIITNRPAIMRMNPWVQSFMPFYNFFNNAAQRLYEYGWKTKLAAQGRELPEMTGFEKEQFEKGRSHIPEILGGFLTFGVITSLVEQAVDPLPSDNKENPIKHGAKVIARGPIAMIPGLRDFMNAQWEGHDPSAGLMGSFYRDVTAPLTNKSGQLVDTDKLMRRINMLFGALTGLTYDEVGKVGQYMYNVGVGKEHPKVFGDLYRGYRHGTQKEQRR